MGQLWFFFAFSVCSLENCGIVDLFNLGKFPFIRFKILLKNFLNHHHQYYSVFLVAMWSIKGLRDIYQLHNYFNLKTMTFRNDSLDPLNPANADNITHHNTTELFEVLRRVSKYIDLSEIQWGEFPILALQRKKYQQQNCRKSWQN